MGMKILRCWCSRLVQVQFPLEANFLLKLIYPSLRNNTKMTTVSTLLNYGKSRLHVSHSWFVLSEDGNMSVVVRLSGAANYSMYVAARYGEPIDFENWLVDYWGSMLCMYNHPKVK